MNRYERIENGQGSKDTTGKCRYHALEGGSNIVDREIDVRWQVGATNGARDI
jgi:hypothetical protein